MKYNQAGQWPAFYIGRISITNKGETFIYSTASMASVIIIHLKTTMLLTPHVLESQRKWKGYMLLRRCSL
ncbi:PH domain-containing protein [Aeromonas salmonicida]|uniref:PH domain-containing protein n=1 Tax=Aeromonas salmonicida TaxID=645 RepID=UPI0038D456F3